MLSKVISGGEAFEIRPLEFPQVGPPAPEPARSAAPAVGSSGESAELQAMVQRLQAEIPNIQRQAFDAGRAEGIERARAEIDPVIARLNASIAEIAGMRAEMRRRAERDVVQLALLIAKRVLHRELNVDESAMSALVRVALDRLARSESYKVTAHPRFAGAVAAALPASIAARVRVEADAAREPGTLIIESPDGTVDASIETQLDEIGRGLADRLSHT